MTKSTIELGVGVYSRADAARLLGVTRSRLSRWVMGYSYLYRYHGREKRAEMPPVVESDLPVIADAVALSFIDLMELRVVKALVDKGVSLQHVRTAAMLASEHFGTAHPFASRRVYTDRRRVFAALESANAPSDFVELSQRRIRQIIIGGIFEPFLEQVDFERATSLAVRWWPLGKSKPVVLDPRIAFGAPTIVGTRIRTTTIAQVARGSTQIEAAEAYDLTRSEVRAAVRFETQLAAA